MSGQSTNEWRTMVANEDPNYPTPIYDHLVGLGGWATKQGRQAKLKGFGGIDILMPLFMRQGAHERITNLQGPLAPPGARAWFTSAEVYFGFTALEHGPQTLGLLMRFVDELSRSMRWAVRKGAPIPAGAPERVLGVADVYAFRPDIVSNVPNCSLRPGDEGAELTDFPDGLRFDAERPFEGVSVRFMDDQLREALATGVYEPEPGLRLELDERVIRLAFTVGRAVPVPVLH